MRIVVQKYGGSSLSSIQKIQSVAERIAETRQQGYAVVVVVSAMGGQTDHLLGMARQVNADPSSRELDMLLSTGERVSTALMSMALEQLGCPAVSLSGDQCAIWTDGEHGSAQILEIQPDRVFQELSKGQVVVAAGFQGVSEQQEITTLGRGGSDTSAVALAAALGAEYCDIFSDVDGVYSCDPRIVPTAQRLDEVGYEEMQELSRQGARVLNEQAVEFARGRRIKIHARATFGGPEKTVIRQLEGSSRESNYGAAGVAGRDDVLRVRYRSSDGPGSDELLHALGDYDILGEREDGGQLQVLLSTTNIPSEQALTEKLTSEFDDTLEVSPRLATVAAVGLGMGEEPAAMQHARRALGEAEVPIVGNYTTSEAVTCVVPLEELHRSMQAVHGAFIDAGGAV
jgi:aspartate kinase